VSNGVRIKRDEDHIDGVRLSRGGVRRTSLAKVEKQNLDKL